MAAWHDAVVVLEGERVAYCNAAARRFLAAGVASRERVGRPLAELVVAEDLGLLEGLTAGEAPGPPRELRFRGQAT